MYFHVDRRYFSQQEIDWAAAEASLEVDRSIDEVSWAKPGYRNGMKMLHEFCQKRLKKFAQKRNDPLGDAISNLSPWFHFGQNFICFHKLLICNV